ncbi:hypothetical protein EIP86_001208 [Pleurotus ostreatoroseus]|nr:hypothetical protein EIP86_001208 [Pleurotus ostreatoroseus]
MFLEVLNLFGIKEKLLAITADNASNNDAMIAALKDHIETFPGKVNRGFCFVHVLNLCARSTLRPFDVEKGNADAIADEATKALATLMEGLDVADPAGTEADGIIENLDDLDGWVDELAGLSKDGLVNLKKEVLSAKLLLAKLRKLAHTVINSTTIYLPNWYMILSDLNLAHKSIPRNVRTRWNSTYWMLVFCLEYCAAIDRMTSAKDLRKFELDELEWEIAEQLKDVLQMSDDFIYYDATQYFSRQAHPNLLEVIPAIDKIHDFLSDISINDFEYQPAIRAAAALGLKTLNRYYDKTDRTETYHIAMSKYCLITSSLTM